jgi:lipopolysaccharide export LptBFGC system permease protein LptF
MNQTLFRYIFKMQLQATLFVSAFAFGLVLLFDFAEVMRKCPISNVGETFFAIKLALLRTPSTFCEVLHYVYFVSATFCFWNLCRTRQMTILKAIGLSPKRILYPFLSFAAFVGGAWLFALHPAGLLAERICEETVSPNASAENNRDVWIDCSKNDKTIFIKNVCGNEIEGLNIFNSKDGSRIFARRAFIEKKVWNLENVAIIKDDKIKIADAMQISNVVSSRLINLIAQSPKKQNIYRLYKIYKIQKEDGVTLALYELELHKLLVNFFNFFLFVLIAAVVCFPINRYKTKTGIAVKVIFTAVFLKFANNMLESLAHCGTVPPQFACWAILLALTCFSVALLIWREA